mmetsp:Transcript_5206/g.12446  ORF Transcript_5206/g.12446 Transcript_5206/m.12446 type:complete len:200 (+) Transcript_5206:223-822(+)
MTESSLPTVEAPTPSKRQLRRMQQEATRQARDNARQEFLEQLQAKVERENAKRAAKRAEQEQAKEEERRRQRESDARAKARKRNNKSGRESGFDRWRKRPEDDNDKQSHRNPRSRSEQRSGNNPPPIIPQPRDTFASLVAHFEGELLSLPIQERSRWFRRQALQCHPDKMTSNDDTRFKALLEAFHGWHVKTANETRQS